MPQAIVSRVKESLKTDTLHDLQSEADHRALKIDKVGIRGLQMPISISDRNRTECQTIGTFDVFVDLPADVKGTHMSRFVEILQAHKEPFSVETICDLLTSVQHRLDAHSAYLSLEFPYFLEKEAPVTRLPSPMNYQVSLHAELTPDGRQLTQEIKVPVKTLCPCSKSISKYGAHNQRGIVTVKIRSNGTVWTEEIIETVEASGSSELYALLKRPDEKFVTEKAYENPVFVEDLVRNVVTRLKSDPRIHWYQVEAENQESIHNHNAYAQIRSSD